MARLGTLEALFCVGLGVAHEYHDVKPWGLSWVAAASGPTGRWLCKQSLQKAGTVAMFLTSGS